MTETNAILSSDRSFTTVTLGAMGMPLLLRTVMCRRLPVNTRKIAPAARELIGVPAKA
jgi:hypothetical protein